MEPSNELFLRHFRDYRPRCLAGLVALAVVVEFVAEVALVVVAVVGLDAVCCLFFHLDRRLLKILVSGREYYSLKQKN